MHIHLVTNTVSWVNGLKLQNSRADLQRMKDLTNKMCIEKGLSVPAKGMHYDGTVMEDGAVVAWSKDKYKLLADVSKKSYVVDCGIAVHEAKADCCSRDCFIEEMEERGWHTTWTDNRKHITFENDKGDKVRDTNLSKSFNMDISKEGLLNEFKRQNELRKERERKRKKERQIDKIERRVRDDRESVDGESAITNRECEIKECNHRYESQDRDDDFAR